MTDNPMFMPDMGEYQMIAFQCGEDGHFWSAWDSRPRLYPIDFSDELYLDWEDEHPTIAAMAFDDYRLHDLWRGSFLTIEGSQDEIHDSLFLLADINGGVFAAKATSPMGYQAVAYCRIRPLLKGAMREILEVVWFDFAEGVPLERTVRLYGENGVPEYAARLVNDPANN